jgi:hypothetical protein
MASRRPEKPLEANVKLKGVVLKWVVNPSSLHHLSFRVAEEVMESCCRALVGRIHQIQDIKDLDIREVLYKVKLRS